MGKSTSWGRRSHNDTPGEPLSNAAYASIKARILDRVVRPGEKLVETRLAQELGMSRTPVRDALTRLEREGLVSSVPNKGTFVESLSPMDVAEIYDIREMIEGLAARLLARRVTPGEAEILKGLAAKADDESATISDDLAFHTAILEMCGSSRVADVVETFCLHALTYDERTGRIAYNGDLPTLQEGKIPDAHRIVAGAIISGDPARAEEAAREHVRATKARVVKHLMGIEDTG